MDIWRRSSAWTRSNCGMKNFIKARAVPLSVRAWAGNTIPATITPPCRRRWTPIDYRQAARRAEGQAEAFKRGETREIMGIGVVLLHRDRRRRPVEELRHSRHRDVRFLRDPHPSDRRAASPAWAPRARARATRRPRPRSSPPRSAFPPTTSWSRRATPTPRPTASAPTARARRRSPAPRSPMAARKIKAKAQMIAAYMLEVHEDDLEWDVDRFRVKGMPEKFKTMKEIAWAAYNKVPPGMEPGLEAVSYYDPPNMTYPFGAYICVMDIDVDTGVAQGPALLCARRLRHAHQPDDHRGPGPWRPDRGLRHRHGPGDPLRRDGNVTARVVHGLLPADRGRDAALGDRLHGDAVAASSDRRQGRRRKPECRRRAVLLQCGERRLRVPRLDPYPDAARRLAASGRRRRSWGCTG